MAIKTQDVTYSPEAFAAIEVKGVVYFINAGIAKRVKAALTEQMVFTSAENPIVAFLTESSEFVVDFANDVVLKKPTA